MGEEFSMCPSVVLAQKNREGKKGAADVAYIRVWDLRETLASLFTSHEILGGLLTFSKSHYPCLRGEIWDTSII